MFLGVWICTSTTPACILSPTSPIFWFIGRDVCLKRIQPVSYCKDIFKTLVTTFVKTKPQVQWPPSYKTSKCGVMPNSPQYKYSDIIIAIMFGGNPLANRKPQESTTNPPGAPSPLGLNQLHRVKCVKEGRRPGCLFPMKRLGLSLSETDKVRFLTMRKDLHRPCQRFPISGRPPRGVVTLHWLMWQLSNG
jgi:hypothetical protein